MKKVKRTIPMCLALTFAALTLTAAYTPQERKEATKTWLKGFEYYEKADKALQTGQLREANTLFKMAISVFEKVGMKYPKWNSSLISYRIRLCRMKLVEIQKELEKKHIKLTDTDVDRENLELKEKIDELRDKLNETRKELATTLYSLEAARREAARNVKASTELTTLMREKTELQKRCALLEETNKQLRKAHPLTASDAAGEKMLDKTLIKIEHLKKRNAELNDALRKEQLRFAKMAREKTQLQYDKKLLDDAKKRLTDQVELLNARIVEMQSSMRKASVAKEDQDQQIEELKRKLSKTELKLAETYEKLKQTRANSNASTVIKQMENENELMLRDLEVANLNLEKTLKDKKNLATENARLRKQLKKLRSSFAAMDADRAKTAEKLEVLTQKLFVSETIAKKQDVIIKQQKKRFSELKKEFDTLVDKYKHIDKKEKAFTQLAKQSLAVENENRKLKAELEAAHTKNKKLSAAIKQNEMRVVQLQEECKKLISDNADARRKAFLLQNSLKEKNDSLAKQLEELKILTDNLKKSKSDDKRKLEMLTEELVNANAEIDSLKKRLAETTARMAKASVPREPEMADMSGKLKALKRRNSILISQLQELNKKLRILRKEKNEALKAAATLSPTEKKRIEKMLDSATLAEEEDKKEAAIWYYEKVLEEDPANATALARLAYIKAERGEDAEAIKLINKALAKTPDDLELLQALAVCHSRREEYYKALGAAAKANAINPKDAVTQRYLGIICSHLGWVEAAKRQFRSSFKLDPTSAETAYNAAVLLLSTKGGLPEAKLWYDKAVQLGAQRDPKIEELFKDYEEKN